MPYKYRPEDYDELLCEYMTNFYRAYEEKNWLYCGIGMERLFLETKIAMKDGDITSAQREEMLAYFWTLHDEVDDLRKAGTAAGNVADTHDI